MIKKISVLLSLTLLLFLSILGCSCSMPEGVAKGTEPAAPNALLPSIMIDDTLYYFNGNRNPGIQIAESEFLGRIASTVPLSQRPTENEQASIDVAGAPYAKYEDGIAVLWNDKWTLFVTLEELLSQN